MTAEDKQLSNRFRELYSRSESRGVWVSSEFLTLAEQDVLLSLRLGGGMYLDGGYPMAERKIAMFGSEENTGYTETPPIVCLTVQPVSEKFAQELSHRDYLGSLMGMGIRREVLGDIVVSPGRAWLFCLDTIADYIIENLTQVRRTQVRVSKTDTLPEQAASREEKRFAVASERLDSIVAAVYKLSRADSQRLFAQKKIFVNSRLTENTSLNPKEGDIISVRGYGRFVYMGVTAETRRGRLWVNVEI